ncbi:MAG: hypothetical protein LC676_04520 [Loktanella sp.]|nr:hypothetical protein [Loktanella sp.]
MARAVTWLNWGRFSPSESPAMAPSPDAPSYFRPGQDVLLVELLDPGSAGAELEIDLVLEPATFAGQAGTLVRLRATGPGLDDETPQVIARLVGVSPEDMDHRTVIYQDVSSSSGGEGTPRRRA